MFSFQIYVASLVLPVAVDGFAIQRTRNQSLDAALYISDMLWQGMDVGEEDLATTRAFPHAIYAVSEVAATPCDEHVLVVGPPDSGTNLMNMLLRKNLPTAVGGCKVPGCPHKFWKHSNSGYRAFLDTLERLGSQADGLGPEATKVIAVLRSPISQASSWHKAAYDLSPCASRQYSRWQDRCSPIVSASLDLCRPTVSPLMTSDRDNSLPVVFDGTMEVYNAYVRQYLSLASCGRLRGLKIVTYEEMLYDPERVIKELSEFLGAPMPQSVDVISAPAKDHGDPHGRDLAMQIYRERRWRNEIGPTSIKSICRKLDVGLLVNLTEGKSFTNERDREPLPYSYDCQG